eukprot:UN14662
MKSQNFTCKILLLLILDFGFSKDIFFDFAGSFSSGLSVCWNFTYCGYASNLLPVKDEFEIPHPQRTLRIVSVLRN